MKPVVQIDYKFILCKHFKLAKRHTTSNIRKKNNYTSNFMYKRYGRKKIFYFKKYFLVQFTKGQRLKYFKGKNQKL
jgi:hypothetical protein